MSGKDPAIQSSVATLVIFEPMVLFVDIVGGPDGTADVVGGAARAVLCVWVVAVGKVGGDEGAGVGPAQELVDVCGRHLVAPNYCERR